MHKFVVIKSAKQAQNTSQQPEAPKIRMTGYLKKKRKKMGGWRKLWFVLQNRLLLSYSSREDYEKKLAPFKGVVSLVPGTLIKPGKGHRFIIETTTNIIYTYRCDDYKTCSEWMGALVESLAADIRSSFFQIQTQNKYNRSLDNLPLYQSKRSIKSSRSWDSICQAKNGTSSNTIKSLANLPIAINTARILERNGLQYDDINDDHEISIEAENDKCERVQNFRLHQQNDHQKVNQSHEVCRINSMFKKNSDSTVRLVKQHTSNNRNNNTNYSNTNKNTTNNNNSSNYNNSTISDQANSDRSNEMDSNENTKLMEKCGNCPLEEKIFKLSLIDLAAESRRSDKITNMSCKEPSKGLNVSNEFTLEPIYAVVDLKNKYARRAKMKEMHDKLEKERPRSCNVLSSDYEEILQFPNLIELNEDENENIYEPVNIPELPAKSPMWRYFPKINLEALIELTKKKSKDEPSTFYDIRKRWGNHRKSIKNRMKKLVSKDSAKDSLNSLSDDDLGSQGASCASSAYSSSKSSASSIVKDDKFALTAITGFDSSDREKKSDKHLFGSLGRLRRSRTSLILDEMSPRKKLIISDDMSFQKELRKELIKRNGSINEKNENQCHSKFYD